MDNIPREIIGLIAGFDIKIYLKLILINKKFYSACREYVIPKVLNDSIHRIDPNDIKDDVSYRLNLGFNITLINENKTSLAVVCNVGPDATTYHTKLVDGGRTTINYYEIEPKAGNTLEVLTDLFNDGYRIPSPMILYRILDQRGSGWKNLYLRLKYNKLNKIIINRQVEEDYQLITGGVFNGYLNLINIKGSGINYLLEITSVIARIIKN